MFHDVTYIHEYKDYGLISYIASNYILYILQIYSKCREKLFLNFFFSVAKLGGKAIVIGWYLSEGVYPTSRD
jgi:hypothetical protein